MWTPPALPTAACAITIQHDPEQQIQSFSTDRHTFTRPGPSERKESPEVQHKPAVVEGTSLNGGENTGRQEQEGRDGECTGGGGEEEPEEGREDGKHGGEEEERENGGGEGEEDGEKDKNEDQDKDDDQEEEEEEEDFDDLTQDEDDEEVMSSASEESVLSVPELQVENQMLAFPTLSSSQIAAILVFIPSSQWKDLL